MDSPAPDNIAAEEGGQDEKEHRPMFRRVKDKMKKIKNTISGHGHDHDHEQDTGGDSNSADEEEEDATTREAEVEKGGHDSESERIPAAAKEVKHNDAPAAAQEVKRDFGGPASAKEVKRDDAPGVRVDDLGAPAAAQEVKRDDATATGMRLSDFGGPASAKEVKRDDAQGVRLGDLGSAVVEDPAEPNSRTPMPRGGEDMGTTDAVRNLEAMTVSDDDPKQVGARKMDVDVSKEYEAMPVSDGTGEEWNDAPTDAEKVAGVGTVVASKAQQVTPGLGAGAPESVTAGAGKRDLDLPQERTRASYTGTEELKNAATGAEGPKKAATDATGAEGLKNAETGAEELKKVATDATTEAAPAATYTDMIMSAAAGTAEYGKKLASTVYEKVAGIGTSEASKAQQVTTSAGTATPGVGAQDGATTTRATGGPGNGQDKGATGVTAYIAEKLRPGDEERSLSEAITGAVQQRKEGVGSTVAQAVTSARGAVTSLTGGNRVSETVQPSTEGNIGEGVAAEGQVLHGAAPSTNTNAM